MSAAAPVEIRGAVERHVELWNAGDKEAWLAHWKRVVPGEITMEDPLGSPIERGWDARSHAWDRANADWKLDISFLGTRGSTVVAIIRNLGTVNGEETIVESVQIYDFGADGSLHGSTFCPQSIGSEYLQWIPKTGGD